MRIIRALRSVGLSISCAFTGACVASESWPERPVSVVIPYPAGGMADVVARILTTELTKALRQPFIPEPKPGANSNIAANTVAKANPDGYTLLISGPWFAINQFVETGKRWKTESLVPVARFALTDNILAVSAKSKANSLADYISLARNQKSAPLQYGSPGIGSTQRMAAELFLKEAGIKVEPVQYKGAPPIIPDLVSSRVSMAVLAAGNITTHVKSGQLKALATFGEKRGPNTPSVPTMAELGYPKAIVTSWFGLHAPASTPEPIINRLTNAIEKILQKSEVLEMLRAADAVPAFQNTSAFASFIHGEEEIWREVASGLEAQP